MKMIPNCVPAHKYICKDYVVMFLMFRTILSILPGLEARMFSVSRKVLSMLPSLAWLVLLAATEYSCVSSAVFRKELVFQREDLQQKIEPKFPLKKKKALIAATFSDPTVLLAEGADRLGIGLAVKVALPGGKTYHGNVEIDAELDYNPDRGEFLVVNSRLRTLRVAQMPDTYQGVIQALVNKMAQHYLSNLTLQLVNKMAK